MPLQRQPPKRRMRIPFLVVFALAAAAIAVAALGLVPTMLEHYGVVVPKPLDTIFHYIDLAGEMLLGLFAILLVLKARNRDR